VAMNNFEWCCSFYRPSGSAYMNQQLVVGWAMLEREQPLKRIS